MERPVRSDLASDAKTKATACGWLTLLDSFIFSAQVRFPRQAPQQKRPAELNRALHRPNFPLGRNYRSEIGLPTEALSERATPGAYVIGPNSADS